MWQLSHQIKADISAVSGLLVIRSKLMLCRRKRIAKGEPDFNNRKYLVLLFPSIVAPSH